MKIFFILLVGIVIGVLAYLKNRQTNKSFAEKIYLLPGEKEIKLYAHIFASGRFGISWKIYPSAEVRITNMRVIIRNDTAGVNYIAPVSLFYGREDKKISGMRFQSYLISSISKDFGKTTIKASSFGVILTTWKIDGEELYDVILEARVKPVLN